MITKHKLLLIIGALAISFSACQIDGSKTSKNGSDTETPVVKNAPVITSVAFYKSEAVGSESTSFVVNGDASDAIKLKVNIEDAESDTTKLNISVKFTEEGSAEASYSFDLPQQKFSKCFYFNTDVIKANGANGSYEFTFTAEDGAGNKSKSIVNTLAIDNKEATAADAAKTVNLTALKSLAISYDEIAQNTEANTDTTLTDSVLVDKGDYYIYSGDIILFKNDPNHKKLIDQILESQKIQTKQITYAQSKFAQKGATEWWVSTWPGNTVHYYFDSICPLNDSEKQTVRDAMKILESTCSVRFIEENDNIFVARYKIYKGTNKEIGGCSTCGYSIFGGWYEFQSNSVGTSLHEIMHGLGMMHEHQRPDRDNYVTIHTDNVLWYQQSQFWILYGAKTYSNYDYLSIMHYPFWAFNVNKDYTTMTIETKDPVYQKQIGNRTALSESDKSTLKTLYTGGQSNYWRDCNHWCWQPYTETQTRVAWRWAHLWHFCWVWNYRTLWTYPYFDLNTWTWQTGEVKGWIADYQGWLKECGHEGWDHPVGWEAYNESYQATLWGFRWMSGCGQKFWPHQEWVW